MPVDRENALTGVNAGGCDIVMTGLVLVSPMMEKARFTARGPMDLHLALVTRDERTGAFEDLDAVARTEGLQIAVAGDTDYDRAAAALFPPGDHRPLEDPEQFFDRAGADALLTTAETGTPLTLLHPFFAVAAVQYSGASAASSVYALARDCDDASLLLTNYWLAMEERSGALEAKYRLLGAREGDGAPGAAVVGHPGTCCIGSGEDEAVTGRLARTPVPAIPGRSGGPPYLDPLTGFPMHLVGSTS